MKKTNNNYTLRLKEERVAQLKSIAQELGYTWGGDGSIARLLVAICEKRIILTKEKFTKRRKIIE